MVLVTVLGTDIDLLIDCFRTEAFLSSSFSQLASGIIQASESIFANCNRLTNTLSPKYVFFFSLFGKNWIYMNYMISYLYHAGTDFISFRGNKHKVLNSKTTWISNLMLHITHFEMDVI